MASFEVEVDAIVAKTEKRMAALVKASVSDVIDIAQMPVAKGGKMRVDTGFLRASGQVSFTGLPTGPVRGDKKEPNSYRTDEANVTLQINNYKFGQTIYFGWTAAYARYREAFDGFLETAVQRWPEIVAKRTEELKGRIE